MSVGIESIPGVKYKLGVGYIAIPSDIERDQYLKDCYLNNQVSFWTEDGGFENRVPISQDILNFITFPKNKNELGSAILYGIEDIHQKPVILTRIHTRDELGDGKENEFKFRRKLNGKIVEISGSSDEASLNLVVDGDDNNGQLNLKVINRDQNSLLNIEVAGNGQVTCSDGFSFHQQTSFRTETENDDESAVFEQTTTEHNFRNKRLIVNDGDDPLVLGKELKEFLSNFIDQVANITVTTGIGLQPILNKVQVLQLKNKLDTFLSKIIFTDK